MFFLCESTTFYFHISKLSSWYASLYPIVLTKRISYTIHHAVHTILFLLTSRSFALSPWLLMSHNPPPLLSTEWADSFCLLNLTQLFWPTLLEFVTFQFYILPELTFHLHSQLLHSIRPFTHSWYFCSHTTKPYLIRSFLFYLSLPDCHTI